MLLEGFPFSGDLELEVAFGGEKFEGGWMGVGHMALGSTVSAKEKVGGRLRGWFTSILLSWIFKGRWVCRVSMRL